ncbi:DUF3299 domain-containing protein [Microbulbifer sp. JMSA002]|uniref:DUF3299 domain-containing protein n=1 Tax=Microbulbifer sp. JMSA002 TaxID=3243368 RepID=UPI004039532F
MTSTRIKPELDNQQIPIAGFIVPIEFNDELTISSFLFVPYFGACIHFPPISELGYPQHFLREFQSTLCTRLSL